MKVKGVITVYLSMIFLLVLSIIFSVTESARVQATRMLMETGTDAAMESFFSKYQRDLYMKYNVFFFDGSYGSGKLSEKKLASEMEDCMEYILKPNKKMWQQNTDFYQIRTCGIKMDKLALATDHNGKVFRNQAIEYMKSKVKIDRIKELTKNYDWAMNNLEETEKYTEKETEIESSLIDLEDEKKTVDEEKASEAESAKSLDNPTAAVKDLRFTGILSLMYKDTSQISQKSINIDHLPSKRKLNKGTGLDEYEDGMMSDIWFQTYLMEKFPNAATKKADTEGNLKYQLEYLLIGKNHDVDNLKGVINRLILMREGANYAYLITDSAKVAQAYGMAALLVGYTGIVPLIEATKYALLLGWAYAESVLDVKILLAGEKVALVKNAATWKTGLSNLGDLITKDVEEMGDSSGITYEEYLQTLLMVANQDELTMRALDLIEVQMGNDAPDCNIRMDHCIADLQMTVETFSESLFLDFNFFNGLKKEKQHKMTITRRRGYHMW